MEPDDKDQFEEWLDRALQQYGRVNARPGLEGRILANLAAHRQEGRPFRKWVWAAAVAASVALGFSLWMSYGGHRQQAMPARFSDSHQAGHVGPSPLRPEMAQALRPGKVIAAAHGRSPEARAHIPVKEPRLSQFPAERPLSSQEQLLKRYVEQFPGEATEVAEAQSETQKQLDELIARESSNME